MTQITITITSKDFVCSPIIMLCELAELIQDNSTPVYTYKGEKKSAGDFIEITTNHKEI